MSALSITSQKLLSQSKVKGGRYLDDSQFTLLFNEYRNGSIEARNALIECNMGLVRKYASQYMELSPYPVNSAIYAEKYSTLMQEGALALVHALEKFEPGKSAFSTYAHWWMKEYFGKTTMNDSVVRIPSNRVKRTQMVTTVMNNYQRTYGVKPSMVMLSELTGLSVDHVTDALVDSYAKNDTLSMDQQLGEDDSNSSMSNYDLITSQITLSELSEQDESVNDNFVTSWLKSKLSELNEREQLVVESYFGLNDDPMTFLEIGKMLGVSKERARQLLASAKNKIKKSAEIESVSSHMFL